jgi:putative flippase GtrA
MPFRAAARRRLIDMSNLSRRPGSRVSRSTREKRAFRYLTVGGGAAAVAVVALVLSIVGVGVMSLFWLGLAVAIVCGILFRQTVSK